MRNRTPVLVTALLVVALAAAPALSACGPKPEPPGPVQPTTPVAPTMPADFSYLTGSWWMDFSLVEIDDPALAEAATPVDVAWTIDVQGSAMSVFTRAYPYSGVITPDGDGWVFQGVGTSVDDNGVTWTGTMVLRVPDVSESSFSGTMELTEKSDADGHRYAGVWEFNAAIQ